MHPRMLAAAGALALLTVAVPASKAQAAPESDARPAATAAPAGTYASCQAPQRDGQMQCLSVVRAQSTVRTGVLPAATPSGYSPADLRAAYNLPSTTEGTGQTVAIVDAYHNPRAAADLAVYRKQYGLPPCTVASGCFTQVDQRGGTQWAAYDAGWAGEISLDLQMVSAVCPACHLLLVEADTPNSSDLYAAEDEAIALGARFVSNSWGGLESSDEAQVDDRHFDRPGVVITASTGDEGFPGGYPAVSQYVTAVGGTTLTRDPETARGWTESAWRLAGSTCSPFEPAPAFQNQAMTDCNKRATADVSAVADPATGVAVYDDGWHVFGGTSVGAPLIAATYALAGSPLTGSRPNALPYQHPDALNDVTSGDNGCSFKFCVSGPGWDGPTGLGTPNGVAAFSPGPHGELVGTVTDAATGEPLAGTDVIAGGQRVVSGAHGEYALTLPPGHYTLAVQLFGYQESAAGVDLSDGQTQRVDAALTPRPHTTVSGTVRDDAGHGWPVYASVQVAGEPSTRVFTDPATGAYQLSVPKHDTYDLEIRPVYPGYADVTDSVPVDDDPVIDDIADPVPFAACTTAPGYAYTSTPVSTEPFDGTSAPDGWTTVNAYNRALLWSFDDPGGRGNLTGGDGGFAIVDSDFANQSFFQDTSLISPVWDLSGLTHPALSFRTDYFGMSNSRATVELSSDGGQSWTQLWIHQTDSVRGPDLETIDLTPWAGQSAVQVRFRYQGYATWWWEVDDVTLADRACTPQPGGLLLGQVTDKNTGSGLTGASVVDADSRISTTTVATPDDAAQPEGLYWTFAAPGVYALSASQPGGYRVVSHSAQISDDGVTPLDFALPAGRVAVSAQTVTSKVTLGGGRSTTLTVRNTGTAPVRLALHDVPGGSTPMAVTSDTPTRQVRGEFPAGPGATALGDARADATVTPAATPWATVADYPIPIADNAMAANRGGKLYSAGGYSSNGAVLARAYRYDPATGAWSRLPNMTGARDYPQAAVLDGRFYVAGGFDPDGNMSDTMEVYNPTTNTWTDGPAMPTGVAAAGVAVLDNRMYVVGGCTGTNRCGTPLVQVYDPATGRWEKAASYPDPVNLEGCGAIAGELYCAGGISDQFGPSRDAYGYDPATDRWHQVAGMPYGSQYAAAYSAADGRLLMVGGVISDGGLLTNQGWAFDPATNSWSSLPNANTVAWRGAGACGFYKVGGSALSPALSNAEMLPGYSDCASAADVGWLSYAPTGAKTLAPGASVSFTVTMSAKHIHQPGIYQAGLSISEDTPYPYRTIPVTMTVRPPATWAKLAGTVRGRTCAGAKIRLSGATVSVIGQRKKFTLKTGTDGRYQLWLNAKNSPLKLVFGKNGWAPTVRTRVRLTKGRTTTVGVTLHPQPAC